MKQRIESLHKKKIIVRKTGTVMRLPNWSYELFTEVKVNVNDIYTGIFCIDYTFLSNELEVQDR